MIIFKLIILAFYYRSTSLAPFETILLLKKYYSIFDTLEHLTHKPFKIYQSAN